MNAALRPGPPLWRSFLAFLGPMMLSNVLQAGSGTASNIFLGQMIGIDAMAAASVFFPLVFFLVSLVIGMGAGASVLIGQAWGAGEVEQVRRVAASTMTAVLAGGFAVSLLLTPLARPLLEALGTPAAVLPGAVAYATVMLGFMPLLFAFLLLTMLLRGVGDTVTPLWALAIALGVSMVATPALIRGVFGLPRLGVAAAAWGAVLAWAVGLAWLGWSLRRQDSPMAPDRRFGRAMRPDRRIVGEVLRLGVPSAVQMVAMALAEMVLLGLVNRYGPGATAAYGAVNQVMAYVQFPAMSVGITVSILSAQAIGAGRTARLPAILRTGLVLNLVITGALVVVATLFSRRLVELFIASRAVVGTTESLLHIVLWSVVVSGITGILAGQMRASGVVLVPTLILVLSIALVEVPVAWGLSHLIGLDGVWIAYPAATVVMALADLLYFRLVWRHKPILRLA